MKSNLLTLAISIGISLASALSIGQASAPYVTGAITSNSGSGNWAVTTTSGLPGGNACIDGKCNAEGELNSASCSVTISWDLVITFYGLTEPTASGSAFLYLQDVASATAQNGQAGGTASGTGAADAQTASTSVGVGSSSDGPYTSDTPFTVYGSSITFEEVSSGNWVGTYTFQTSTIADSGSTVGCSRTAHGAGDGNITTTGTAGVTTNGLTVTD